MSGIVSQKIKSTPTSKIITLAAGCFWGVEHVFRKQFANKGLIDIKVGYADGLDSDISVSYQEVCTGKTNFAEAIQISYEPSKSSLNDLLDIFFRMHDPTQVNSQGPDRGTQYRSGIYLDFDEDFKVAQESKEYFQKEWYPKLTIATSIEPLKSWIDAEDYHQEYLDKNPGGYECPSHFIRTKPQL